MGVPVIYGDVLLVSIQIMKGLGFDLHDLILPKGVYGDQQSRVLRVYTITEGSELSIK